MSVKRGLLLPGLLVLALAGCAPVVVGRFIPDPVAGMRLTGAPCGSGRASTAEFMQDEVAIRVSLANDRLLLVLEVPAGHQVRLSSLAVEGNGRLLTLAPPRVYDHLLQPVTLDDPLLVPGRGIRRWRWLVTPESDLPRTAGFELTLPVRADSWRIRLPLLYIDSRPLQLPELLFHYREALEVSSLNC